jgi:Dyp-type peroxidase family
MSVDFADIQGLLRWGYGAQKSATDPGYPESDFLLLRVRDPAAGRTWLAAAPVANALPADPRPVTVLQIAISSAGLATLGADPALMSGFPSEFISGMAGHPDRSRRLGDVGVNDPQHWAWGSAAKVPHVLLLLYARAGELARFRAEIDAAIAPGFETLAVLPTSDIGGREHFGFMDGMSQPRVDWALTRPVADQTQTDYRNDVCLGEFVLGYPNEYGSYTDRPLIDPHLDPQGLLPRADDAPDRADFGRNGSYLVLRQIRQDVTAFWQCLDRLSRGVIAERDRLAALMVGRTRDGKSLSATETADPINGFDFRSDPDGLRCPLGAHVRRTNPRNADLPANTRGLWRRLVRMLGFDADALAHDRVASTRFHRLLRRGRPYGPALDIGAALDAAPGAGGDRGLLFVTLGGNIGRQFEFVQSAWIASTRFDRLSGEADPLLGSRAADADGSPTDHFSLQRDDGPDQKLQKLPPFVNVVGGGYFFLPGLRALRYLAIATATATGRGPGGAMDSNTSKPVPPANTGSKCKNVVADVLLRMIQIERRFDPWLRPPFDAVLRDPIANFVSGLISRRQNPVGLNLAEEHLMPDEEVWVDSIIDSFQKQMTGLWKPGGFERGGNTKTQGIVRAELVVHDGLPSHLRHGVFAEPRRWPAWVRFSGPGPYVTPDIDDVGFMSISIKLMGVPGAKLMDEEKSTQDFFGVSTPTFVTQDVRSNAHLQLNSLQNAAIYHFLNFDQPHLLDMIMQGLFTKTQSSPFEAPYFSCVPYLLGAGQAMQYSVWPTSKQRSRIPRLPFRPPDDYLRQAMVAALNGGDVDLEFRVQVQTDPKRMPIENNGILWPEKLSPRVPVATLHIPRQQFNSPAQIAFARRLSYNPWHCIADHRPLGNQSRARKRMYWELSKLRHNMNAVPRYEPDGSESFE